MFLVLRGGVSYQEEDSSTPTRPVLGVYNIQGIIAGVYNVE